MGESLEDYIFSHTLLLLRIMCYKEVGALYPEQMLHSKGQKV